MSSVKRTRKKVICTCVIYCNGNKLVDPRTKNKHEETELIHQLIPITKTSNEKPAVNLDMYHSNSQYIWQIYSL